MLIEDKIKKEIKWNDIYKYTTSSKDYIEQITTKLRSNIKQIEQLYNNIKIKEWNLKFNDVPLSCYTAWFYSINILKDINTSLNGIEDFLIINIEELNLISTQLKNKKDFLIIENINEKIIQENYKDGYIPLLIEDNTMVNIKSMLSLDLKYNIKTKQFFFIINVFNDNFMNNKEKKEIITLLWNNSDNKLKEYIIKNTTERIYNNDNINSFVISDFIFLDKFDKILKKYNNNLVMDKISESLEKKYFKEEYFNVVKESSTILKQLNDYLLTL